MRQIHGCSPLLSGRSLSLTDISPFLQSQIITILLCFYPFVFLDSAHHTGSVSLSDWLIVVPSSSLMPLQMAGCSIYHIFIFPSIYRPLDCFRTLAIVNDADRNIRMQISLKYTVFISSGYVSRREMTGSHGSSMSNFLRNMFSTVTVPISSLTSWVQTFLVKWDAIFVKVETAVCWGRYYAFQWNFRDSVAFQCLWARR